MPVFTYQGIDEEAYERRVESAMAPLMDDYDEHRHFGGFPRDPHGNQSAYYPSDKDKGKQIAEKEKRRDAFRAKRIDEYAADKAKEDASIRFGDKVFPKGESVEIKEDRYTKALIAKLRAMPARFVEGEPEKKRGPGRPKKEEPEAPAEG